MHYSERLYQIRSYLAEGRGGCRLGANSRMAWPAMISSGEEVISAGEQGDYLYVTKIGEGYLIYCGLPLLEMAAELNVEDIHFLANILNFGHGK